MKVSIIATSLVATLITSSIWDTKELSNDHVSPEVSKTTTQVRVPIWEIIIAPKNNDREVVPKYIDVDHGAPIESRKIAPKNNKPPVTVVYGPKLGTQD